MKTQVLLLALIAGMAATTVPTATQADEITRGSCCDKCGCKSNCCNTCSSCSSCSSCCGCGN